MTEDADGVPLCQKCYDSIPDRTFPKPKPEPSRSIDKVSEPLVFVCEGCGFISDTTSEHECSAPHKAFLAEMMNKRALELGISRDELDAKVETWRGPESAAASLSSPNLTEPDIMPHDDVLTADSPLHRSSASPPDLKKLLDEFNDKTIALLNCDHREIGRLLNEKRAARSAIESYVQSLERECTMELLHEKTGKMLPVRVKTVVEVLQANALTVREAAAILDDVERRYFPHNAEHLFSGIEKLRRISSTEVREDKK